MRRYASLILVLSLIIASPAAQCSCAQSVANPDPGRVDDSKGACACGCCSGSEAGPCMCGCAQEESPQPTAPAPRSAERVDDNMVGAVLPIGAGTEVEASSQAISSSQVEWLLSSSKSIPLYLFVSSFRC